MVTCSARASSAQVGAVLPFPPLVRATQATEMFCPYCLHSDHLEGEYWPRPLHTNRGEMCSPSFEQKKRAPAKRIHLKHAEEQAPPFSLLCSFSGFLLT